MSAKEEQDACPTTSETTRAQGASTSDLPPTTPLWVASRHKEAHLLLVTRSGAHHWLATHRLRGADRGLVAQNHARRRRACTHRQARSEAHHCRSFRLQPQPCLPLSDHDLRWDSSPEEFAMGHPVPTFGAVCDPARGDRARGTLPG